MKPLRYFIDTHDKANGSSPEALTPEQFEGFYARYQDACRAEGVVPVRTDISYADGRAFCLNLAEDAEAVRRAHARVGLPFATITEVTSATPGDTFNRRQSHFSSSTV